jgi:hypothetical protein
MRLLSDLVASTQTTKWWIYFQCHYYTTATDVRAGHVIRKKHFRLENKKDLLGY